MAPFRLNQQNLVTGKLQIKDAGNKLKTKKKIKEDLWIKRQYFPRAN